MSSQKFSPAEREAIWVAHDKKCAYTRELLDISNFHIDHIIPESLAEDAIEFMRTKEELGLPDDFDLFGYENIVPCRPGANLQKGALVLEKAHIHYFLGIASSKKREIKAILLQIERRKNRGRAIILLQQCLERDELSAKEVSEILVKYDEQPEEIFELLEGMQFANSEDIRFVAKAEIETLRDQPIRLGQNDHLDGVTLTNRDQETRHVRTCREYDEALKLGYFASSNFDLKISAWFEHQCGLLNSLQAAAVPSISYISEPRVGVLDLSLLPFSFFPYIGEAGKEIDLHATYQSKVDEGALVVKRIRQNLLLIEEPEGMGQQLVEVARADLNGDGIEDILLFEYCYATHGTLGYGGIRIITRKTKDGMFEATQYEDG